MKTLHPTPSFAASRLLTVMLAGSLLAGCASKMILLPREGGESITGTVSSTGVMAVTLAGHDYQGSFVPVDGGTSTGTFNSYGRRFRTGTYQTYTPPRNARALLVAGDGNTLRCEFTFGGEGGVGSCITNDRHEYDLMIRND
jgi:hypothetical protein